MIKLYTKDNCVACRQTKKFFKDNHIIFQEINIENNTEYRDILFSQGFRSLPVVFPITSKIKPWSGFNLEKLKSLISSII